MMDYRMIASIVPHLLPNLFNYIMIYWKSLAYPRLIPRMGDGLNKLGKGLVDVGLIFLFQFP